MDVGPSSWETLLEEEGGQGFDRESDGWDVTSASRKKRREAGSARAVIMAIVDVPSYVSRSYIIGRAPLSTPGCVPPFVWFLIGAMQ